MDKKRDREVKQAVLSILSKGPQNGPQQRISLLAGHVIKELRYSLSQPEKLTPEDCIPFDEIMWDLLLAKVISFSLPKQGGEVGTAEYRFRSGWEERLEAFRRIEDLIPGQRSI